MRVRNRADFRLDDTRAKADPHAVHGLRIWEPESDKREGSPTSHVFLSGNDE